MREQMLCIAQYTPVGLLMEYCGERRKRTAGKRFEISSPNFQHSFQAVGSRMWAIRKCVRTNRRVRMCEQMLCIAQYITVGLLMENCGELQNWYCGQTITYFITKFSTFVQCNKPYDIR